MTPHAPDRRDETGSMVFFLILSVVGLMLAGLLMPLVISSSRTTRSDTSRAHAIDAAQAGVNVMLGAIRASYSPTGQDGRVGDSRLLPCNSMSGQVNAASQAAYAVTVRYYLVDPKTLSPSGQNTDRMQCSSRGGGPYKDGSITPRFALIESRGTDGAATNGSTPGRTIRTTYRFRTTQSPVLGGQIPLAAAGGLCMDAGSPTPGQGVQLTLQACASPSTPQQTFAYRLDLTLQVVSSATATNPDGMCVDVLVLPLLDAPVVMRQCRPLGSATYTQQWSYGDPDGSYQAARSTSVLDGGLSNLCIGAAPQSARTLLRLVGCGGNTAAVGWAPTASVGPGAADDPQLINFGQYGKCLDVTRGDVSSANLIAYQCKQNPLRSSVTWNQIWTRPDPAPGAASALGPISVLKPREVFPLTPTPVRYCLTSPGTVGAYVAVRPCDATNARQTWTVFRDSFTLPYATRYTIVDSGGRCLGLTDNASTDPSDWPATALEACDGASDQKWNAIADPSTAALQDTLEAR